jgi:hypothetical protein
MAASAALARSRRIRASASASCTGAGYGIGSRCPANGPMAERSRSAMSITAATVSASSRMRRIVPPRVTNRPGASCTPTVSLMTSSSTWASSNTTTSWGGRITPPLPTCNP